MPRIDTRTAANVGLLMALSIILTRFLGVMVPISGVLALRLSFGAIPIMVSGMLFGPLAGLITGIGADLIGFMLNPQGGAYFPGFTLTSGLLGFLPGVLFFKRHEKDSLLHLALVVTFVQTLGTILNTYWLTLLMDRGFLLLLPPRLLSLVVSIPLYVVAIYTIKKAYHAAIPSMRPLYK